MKYLFGIFLLLFVLVPGSPRAENQDFAKYEMGFKNFLNCELTRTNAQDHFKGKTFKITMIDLFDFQRESGMAIITGAVQCFVEDDYFTLYAALGVETVLGREQVTYYTIRKKDFFILATELFQFPYKERCPWSRYRIDTD